MEVVKQKSQKHLLAIIIGLSSRLLVPGLGFTSKLDIGLCFSLGFCPGDERRGRGA